jgi:phosphate uptake regulator
VNIAGCVKELVGKPPVRPLADLPELSDKATAMLRDALDAFVRRESGGGAASGAP